MSDPFRDARRRFLGRTGVLGGGLLAGLPGILRAGQAPAARVGPRPGASQGIQIGDVLSDRAVIWSRADAEARMIVEWSLRADFAGATRVRGPHALAATDHTARIDLTGLPPDREVFLRVAFQGLDARNATGEPVLGRFRTAPSRGHRRDVTFLWSGDTCGQGWGIDPRHGGMRIYETMRRVRPDFFIHCGDTVYADVPLQDTVVQHGEVIWTNAHLDLVPAKRKVAETLDEFRGNYAYNRMDAHVRRFGAEVPQIWQWDDHEVTNNWSDGKDLRGDPRYTEKRVPVLVARATRAFLEHAPMRWHAQEEAERVYRHVAYGPDLDVFVIDMRSYRAANSYNRQPEPGPDTRLLGGEQLAWLRRGLAQSRATWKVIASDMPIGLLVRDGTDAEGRARFEAVANGDGPVLGREFEIAELLGFMKRNGIRNVVWLTADVHYTAAHHYDPQRARFADFDPFWEFVSGPLHAGTFGPGVLDDTFGPQVVFQKVPPRPNLPPSAGMQFFGQVDIDYRSKDMVVSLKDVDGSVLFSRRLHAQRGSRGSAPRR